MGLFDFFSPSSKPVRNPPLSKRKAYPTYPKRSDPNSKRSNRWGPKKD